MREILVAIDSAAITYADSTGGGTIAGTWEADLLTAGALAVFDKDGTLIDGAIPVPSSDEITFAIGKNGNGAYLTNHVSRKTLKYFKQVYVAPVAKIMLHGDDNTYCN